MDKVRYRATHEDVAMERIFGASLLNPSFFYN